MLKIDDHSKTLKGLNFIDLFAEIGGDGGSKTTRMLQFKINPVNYLNTKRN